MKQRISIIIFAIISMVSKAQPCINSEANAAKVGDKYTVSQIAYTNIGRVGENVLWNMSGISVGDSTHNVRYIALRDTAQHKYAMIGNKAMRIFQQRGDSLLQTGSKSRLTSVAYDVPIVQLRYPVHYGDTIGGLYGGYGTYANSMRFVECGWYGSKADSYGTLITPDCDTLRNVLRIQSERYVINTIVSSDAGNTLPCLTPDSIRRYIHDGEYKLKIVTTEWYAEGYRYPIVTTVLTNVGIDGGKSMATACYCPPSEQQTLSDEENETVRERQKFYSGGSEQGIGTTNSGFGYNVYAYDDGTGIKVEYTLLRAATVSATVATVGGISLYSMPQRKQEANVYSFDIKADGIGKSAILLNFFVDGKVYQEKIVLK